MALRLLRPATGPLRVAAMARPSTRHLSTVGLSSSSSTTASARTSLLLTNSIRNSRLPAWGTRPNSTVSTAPPPPPSGSRPNPNFNSGPNSNPNSNSSSNSNPEPEPKSAYARFKQLTKTYGSYAVVMYLALSAVDFGLSFALVHTVGADHIAPYMSQLVRWYREFRHGKAGADALERADQAKKAADEAEYAAELAISGPRTEHWWNNKTIWAEVVLAYSIHKVLLLPLRAGLTVAWTPKVVNWMAARGWIGKGGWRRGAQHGVDKARAAGTRAVETAKDAVRRQG